MSAPGRLRDGEPIELVGYDGKLLRLVCARAMAPGQPLEVRAELTSPVEIRGKAVGSKKRDDGRFDVRARLVNLRREVREQLTGMLGDGTG